MPSTNRCPIFLQMSNAIHFLDDRGVDYSVWVSSLISWWLECIGCSKPVFYPDSERISNMTAGFLHLDNARMQLAIIKNMFNIKLLTGIFPYLFLKQLNNAGYSAGNPAIGQTRYPVFRVTRYGICQNQYCGAIIVDGGKYYWGKWENGEQLVQNIFCLKRCWGPPVIQEKTTHSREHSKPYDKQTSSPDSRNVITEEKYIFYVVL